MKWFYIIAVAISLVLAAAPVPLLMYLKPAQHSQPGEIVRYDSFGEDIKSIDPATCADVTSSWIQGNFYEGLYCYHYLLRPPTVIPQLADGMPTISDDGLTYTIKLKSGVKYARNDCFGAEGTRTMKADDFVLAFKRVADYHVETGLAWAFISERIAGVDAFHEATRKYNPNDFSRYDLSIEGIQALDDLTLQIRLIQPFPQMMYVLAMSVYAPVPREAVDYWLKPHDRVEFREPEEVVSTGPYVLSEFKRKDRVVLRRNPNFREEFYPSEGAPGDREAGLLKDAGKRVPFVDVLWYDYVAEDYSAWMRFLARQVDNAGIPKEVFQSVITPGKDLSEELSKKGIRLVKSDQPGIYWLAFNMEDPVFAKSKSLRQALSLSFDVESYIKVLLNGRGKRAVNIIPSGFPGHDEAGPGPYYHLDIKAAQEKIEQARQELGAAGLLEDGKIPVLKLELGGQGADDRQVAEFMQQQFRNVGVEAKAIFNDWSTLQEKMNNKQAQIAAGSGWQADYPDPEDFLQLFYSPNIAKQTNNTNYSNPEYDKLYEKIRTMPDSPERTAICARMAQMIGEDCPVLLLMEPVSFALFQDWLLNVKPHPIGYGFAKYQRIDTKLRHQMGGRE